MEQKREYNYDLLRIICTFSVIVIHVSITYMNIIINEENVAAISISQIMTVCLYNSLTRFAVPCFVMMSGAFLLDDVRNAEYKYFYAKIFRKIGIPTLFFSAFYFLFSLVKAKDGMDLFSSIKSVIKGVPFYHMWYLYMMAGVYLLVPVIHRYKRDVEDKTFQKVAWIFLTAACFSMWTSTHVLKWDIGSSFCYVGYFMVGYVVRKWSEGHKNSVRGVCLIIASLVVEMAVVYLQYTYLCKGVMNDIKHSPSDPQNPLIVVSSVIMFCGFSMIKVNKNFGKISGNMFLVYLIHAGVWEMAAKIAGGGVNGDSRVMIPVCSFIVFVVSDILAMLCKRFFKSDI